MASRGHQVTLASFIRPEEEPFVPRLREVCAEVHTVPIRRSRLADAGYWLRSQLTGRPFLFERDDLPAMRRLVKELMASGHIDMIHADQLTMAQFAQPYRSDSGRPALVFDAHNAVWTIVERMRENAALPLRPVAALEARRVKRIEGQIVQAFDFTLAVTEPDRLALLEAVRSLPQGRSVDGRIRVIPIAVDTHELTPAARPPGSLNILTLGTLNYPPNADGVRWFAREIFPLIRRQQPGATLTIVGKRPPADFTALAAVSGGAITVTGYVPDLSPYMDQAALMVVPVRAGGGMRVRILEAFARAMPVVTTTVGLEGIQAEPGRDVLVADTPEAFARDVLRLLQDADLQARLAAAGRRLAESCYDWQVVLQKMDEIYA